MHPLDRRALALALLLLALPALAALVVALFFPGPKLTTGPLILSPREGDVVGAEFSVDGTHGTPGTDVEVTVSGAYAGTKLDTAEPDWHVTFNAGAATGAEQAVAADRTRRSGTVNFTISGSPALTANDHTVSKSLFFSNVTVRGKHADVPFPSIFVKLIRNDGEVYGPQSASGDGPLGWKTEFAGIPPGHYAAQATLTALGQTTTTSRYVHVP